MSDVPSNSDDAGGRLYRCVRDLAALNALPSMCVGRSRDEVIDIVLDALPTALSCDLIISRCPGWPAAITPPWVAWSCPKHSFAGLTAALDADADEAVRSCAACRHAPVRGGGAPGRHRKREVGRRPRHARWQITEPSRSASSGSATALFSGRRPARPARTGILHRRLGCSHAPGRGVCLRRSRLKPARSNVPLAPAAVVSTS
jgi:hypothetical protein